ncbi:MAG: antibiotic biosynthesis monooxygenase [Legionellales bacterium]|nr:antibiotic biosynthesis monooxygenase [Legionellales bacterium]
MHTEFVCTVKFTAKLNRVDMLIRELGKLIPLTKKEEGCIRYEMYQSLEHSDVVFIFERFKNEAAFNFHRTTEYVKSFMDNQAPNLVEQVKFTRYEEIIG